MAFSSKKEIDKIKLQRMIDKNLQTERMINETIQYMTDICRDIWDIDKEEPLSSKSKRTSNDVTCTRTDNKNIKELMLDTARYICNHFQIKTFVMGLVTTEEKDANGNASLNIKKLIGASASLNCNISSEYHVYYKNLKKKQESYSEEIINYFPEVKFAVDHGATHFERIESVNANKIFNGSLNLAFFEANALYCRNNKLKIYFYYDR